MSRPPEPQRLSRMVEVAFLHHEEHKSKSEIAGKLKVSATEVNRLLRDAGKAGYVQISVVPPALFKLERDLRNHWDLTGATVVPYCTEYAAQLKLLGRAAAKHFEERLQRGEMKRVAVGGGETMWQMASAVGQLEREVEIVPTALIGHGGKIGHADPSAVLTQLFEKGREQCVTAILGSVPPLDRDYSVDIQKEQSMLLERRAIREVRDSMAAADSVYAGVGLVPDLSGETANRVSPTPTIGFLGEIGLTLDDLRKAGAVGDINYSFFNAKGEPVPGLEGVFLALTITDLKGMVKAGKEVVLIAGHKHNALRAVLLGKLCSHLITDEVTARQLLPD